MTSSTLTDVVVRDGSTVCVRGTTEADFGAVKAFFESLSENALYDRFFGIPVLTPRHIRALCALDGTGVSLLALSGERIVAFAGFYLDAPHADRAEVAFASADAYQGRGIATRQLELLSEIARSQGIHTFDAYVRGENRRMMDVFLASGFTVTRRLEAGVYHVELSLSATPLFAERAAMRAGIAATASMKPFFEPRVVAVIGASRRRGKIGGEILHNLIAAPFSGRIVPVHPDATEIAGLKACRRVADIDEPVDLAIVAVPAADVLDAVEACLAAHVRAICIISAGFSECGDEGRAREALLVERIRAAGCRLIGPNCMGLLNTDPAFRLNATFSPVYPPAGGVAMSTQSGALGLAILDYAQRLNIGISSFVSIGNKADVSGNDLIQYWADDPRTSVILLYLESFGNPKKFSEIARRVARRKPIVAVKAGRSKAGRRAASSHTGALAASDAVVDALFRQAGVIRTERLEEMFDVAAVLSHQPVPKGSRVAILTNAGGPGILAADACEANGLELPALSEATVRELRSFLPAAASVGNPVDMLASAPPDHYRRSLAAILADDHIDSVLTIFIPPLVTAPDEVAAAITEGAGGVSGKPVLGVFMRAEGAPANLAPIPCFAFPESAALALARITAYGQWRGRPVGDVPVLDRFDRDAARRVVDTVLQHGGGWLPHDDAMALLQAAGIEPVASRAVSDVDGAVAAAGAIGYPVALKALGPSLLHKTERQAIRLNLASEAALRAAAEEFTQRFGQELRGLLIQRMAPAGVEMLVGAVQDPQFGPILACGSGGVLVDLVADTTFRLHPLTTADTIEMVDGLRSAPLLRGYRNMPPVDERALHDALLRISELVTACPEIQELDLNPLIVHATGVCVVDARLRIGNDPPRAANRRVVY